MNVGINIKRFREEKGMRQVDLAEAINVDRSLIAQFERGTRCPNIILGKQIADVLGVEIKDLMS